MNDVTDDEELKATVADIAALGVKVVAVTGDIADIAGHEALLEKAETALGPLTTLVNNAGVSVQSRGDLLDVTPQSYDRCLDVNTRGTFFLTQTFAKRLKPSSQHRSIVTI